MKIKYILFLLITLTILSCKKSVADSVHPSDLNCKKELKDATTDIKNKKIVYCNYVGNIIFQSLRAEKEMDSLLKIHKIEYKDETSPCVVEENRNYHCYCELMQEEINNKFGEKFTDSLLNIADSLYILKHRNIVFDNNGYGKDWDKCALFPGDKFYDSSNHSGLQDKFDKIVKYPKEYQYRKGEYSSATINITTEIDEKGKAIIKDIYFDFWNDVTNKQGYNREYWDYFEKIVRPLIEKTKWTPAKIKNINVKSRTEVYIYLK